MKLSMDLWRLNNMNVILTLEYWTVDYVPFTCIGSFRNVHNQAN